MIITTTYWYRCSACGDAHRSAQDLSRHHCAHPAPGADEHGHCRLCGVRIRVAHACTTSVESQSGANKRAARR
jgi:hypothetical protein